MKESKKFPPKRDFCEERLPQAVRTERLRNCSLEYSVGGRPGLGSVTDMALESSQQPDPAQRSLWKSAVWENHSDLGASEHRVSKPDFLSSWEEGKEPWMGRRDVAGGLFSRECARAWCGKASAGQQSVSETQELFPKQDSRAEDITDRTSHTKLECSNF